LTSDGGWSTPLPRDRTDRARAVLPAVLLVVVAVVGVRNHVVHDQSSWQGASFGMFATYENDSSRSVAVTVDGGSGPQRVSLPKDLQDDVRRLEVTPSDAAATRLASAVTERVGAGVTVEVVVRRVVLDGDDPLTLHYDPLASGSARR
jgi:hypothetical protein